MQNTNLQVKYYVEKINEIIINTEPSIQIYGLLVIFISVLYYS